MPNNLSVLFLLIFILVVCIPGHEVVAFGAGNIPSFAFLEGKAFRHGDIEDTLADLLKKVGGGFALGSLVGKGGTKFNGLDVKRVYFGNWLRDYSQAVDIAGLKKLPLQTIINLCTVLGFLAHGYATHEFEVTVERLGVYLPTEHIDNPLGYGEGEDARKYDPRLRGPVDPRELEIDPRTGMKNYIANESGHWDTSKALVRRTLQRCIHLGRQHRAQDRKQDLYEAYRLLGQAMHTLEDFPAHSNFCEIAISSMGYHDTFTHVGDQVRIPAPGGKMVPPIVTGWSYDNVLVHELIATDHLSQASVTDLNKEFDKARATQQRSGPGGAADPATVLRELFFSLPGSGGEMSREMESVERIRAGPQQGGKRPEDMNPQELHAVLWQVLTFRDSVMKKIEKTIGPLIEKITDSISVFIFTTLEPFVKPLLKTATDGLGTVSGEVIDNNDQYQVFNDPRASDPTHSFLSKDHFNLILNEPAGHLAKIIVTHTVTQVVQAWDNTSTNVEPVIEEILSCMFHPDFHNRSSKIQGEMMRYMQTWVEQLGARKHATLSRLTKNAVRNHENIRLAGDGGAAAAEGTYAYNQGTQAQHNLQGYVSQQFASIPGVTQAQTLLGKLDSGNRRDGPGTSTSHSNTSYSSTTSAQHASPLPTSGESASYYGTSSGSHYPPPSGPPPSGPTSSYAPSYGSPPPAFPNSAPSFPPSAPASGYAPSYGSPPPSFPGNTSSFPQAGGHHTGHYHPPPPGGFSAPGTEPHAHGPPGVFAPPPGPPPAGPGFAQSNPYGPPGNGPSFPGADPYDQTPQFPNAPNYPSQGGSYHSYGSNERW
ncbi:heterokaryon incompatibility protein Het-C-domain-containing protein [Rhodocollybia butyracea]|uniref:Heterokaryon incompatibility protein Het-C-domain-containing protein n=1 Tax=Rhodocollybia butyracea TaxID=206335 RepID=A0A9P5PSY9_9AGAR|nr:heterokaryon incompatibility protein Het-C-domain-containing protein [Rhodocollybia butyracea]